MKFGHVRLETVFEGSCLGISTVILSARGWDDSPKHRVDID